MEQPVPSGDGRSAFGVQRIDMTLTEFNLKKPRRKYEALLAPQPGKALTRFFRDDRLKYETLLHFEATASLDISPFC